MIRLFYVLVFCIITNTALSQHVEETYPRTLYCPGDTFFLKFKDYPKLFPYKVSRTDKVSPGTDAAPNEYVLIYYGNDSLRLNYHNRLPYGHVIFINFESPKGKTTLRFHFNSIACYFPANYMAKNQGNVQFDIPEPYELANIIWTLSPTGQRAKDLYKEGSYYNKVITWFKPYKTHSLFKALDFPDSLYFDKYYDFRENSFCFYFKNEKETRLVYEGPYYYVRGKELGDSSLFGKLKPLIEDFAAKSKFRQFYKSNQAYYNKELQRQRQLMPVKQMWTWLEEQFPANKYASYRVVSSPLIGGSHSTQRYATPNEKGWWHENVMFICGTDRYDKIDSLSEKQKTGLMSGVVFTEIDHNYVNPVTAKYKKTIDSIFSNRAIWVKSDGNNDNYRQGEDVFNEYMTHAAFCLYIADVCDAATAEFVINNRERLMVDRRKFIRFTEFNRELMRLRQEHKEIKVVDLYPAIINWCKQQL